MWNYLLATLRNISLVTVTIDVVLTATGTSVDCVTATIVVGTGRIILRSAAG